MSDYSQRWELNIAQFAVELGLPVALLLEQFVLAGVDKSSPDETVSVQDKVRLLDFLRQSHGANSPKKKIVLIPRQSKDTSAQYPHKAKGSDNIPQDNVSAEAVDKPTLTNAVSLHGARLMPESSLSYGWPGKFTPFEHQIRTTEHLAGNERAFCLNDMGTGKTLSVLWAYDYLRGVGKVKSMLIICPLSTMVSTWQAEIHKDFCLGSKLLHGVDGAARRKALYQPANIYIMNHDGLKVPGMLDALIARTDIDVVVIDEIAAFRNASTDRWKALNKVIKGRKYVWGLTGTPTPNELTDAWAQCRLISPDRVSPYFGQFKDLVTRQVSQFKWVSRDNALEVVSDAMQPSIRYKREECIDLPPVVYVTHHVEMTDEQKSAYGQMIKTLVAEVKGKVISAFNERVMVTKLLQISCGAVYSNATGDDRVLFIPAEGRLTLAKEIIEDAGGNVIIFVPFRGVLDNVVTALSKYFPVAAIHGGVQRGERDRIFDEFQNKKTVRVLVSIPHAMSHGLNLTAANTIIWFGPIYSNDVYQQANARISRPGQKRKQLIVNIEGTKAEQLIYERLKNRQSLQELLLEILGDSGELKK